MFKNSREKQIFVPNFRQLLLYKCLKERKKKKKKKGTVLLGDSATRIKTNKQEHGQCLFCSSVSFNIRSVLKVKIFKFDLFLDLWLLDNTYNVSRRGQNVSLLLFAKYFLFP